MNSMIIVALALVAVAVAAPASPAGSPGDAQILEFQKEQQPNGNYFVKVKSDNGIEQQEAGELKTVQNEENKPQNVIVVKGEYSYIGPDGTPEKIEYYADETGYHAKGDSIPKVQDA